MADSTKDVPVGTLMTVSAQQDDNGRTQIVVQQGCKSLEATPVDGLFIADCAAVPGMSGSLVYEMGSDKKWHWTGVTTTGRSDAGGETVMIAINAKTIARFFNKAFGEVPLTVPSCFFRSDVVPEANANGSPERAPQRWAPTGRRHSERLRRSAGLETVQGHRLWQPIGLNQRSARGNTSRGP